MADLASGYNIVEKIGTGARSTIYKVVDPRTGQTFALKRVLRARNEDTRYLEQAIREHEISSLTSHPFLRKAYECKKVRKWARLSQVEVVMEYVQGISLEQQRPTDIAETVDLFIRVAEGLDALHQMGYLHTDIKPNNIMICPDGGVKIIDLGQGCRIGDRKPRIQGTPDYISPEQVHRATLTPATDVFNLGATLYWALTAKNIPTMIPKGAPKGVMHLAMPRNIPTPQELNDQAPLSLSRLVMECVQERPSERPRNMGQVINRLEIVHHQLSKRGVEAVPLPEDASGPIGRERA